MQALILKEDPLQLTLSIPCKPVNWHVDPPVNSEFANLQAHMLSVMSGGHYRSASVVLTEQGTELRSMFALYRSGNMPPTIINKLLTQKANQGLKKENSKIFSNS